MTIENCGNAIKIWDRRNSLLRLVEAIKQKGFAVQARCSGVDACILQGDVQTWSTLQARILTMLCEEALFCQDVLNEMGITESGKTGDSGEAGSSVCEEELETDS